MVLTKNIAFPVRLSDATTRPVPIPVEPAIDQAALERERFDKLLTALERRAAEADAGRRAPLDELTRLAIEIGVAAAAKLTHAKIAADEFGIETLVRGAIEREAQRSGRSLSAQAEAILLEAALERSRGERKSRALAYLVTQRTGEIGIRMALGAQRPHVLRLVLLDGLWPALVGLGLGLGGSAAVVRLIRTMLYDTRPLDPSVFAAVAGILLVVAAMACLAPAWRASRLDPMQALRTE